MAIEPFAASFTPIMPAQRRREEILSDVRETGVGRDARAAVAGIELALRDGDAAMRRGRHREALQKFGEARSAIYRILYPGKHFDRLNRRLTGFLPQSAVIEADLTRASVLLGDALRTQTDGGPHLPFERGEALPEELRPLTNAGLAGALALEGRLQAALAHGADLLRANQTAAAIDLMSDALAGAQGAAGTIDPIVLASLELNLASAHVRADQPERAAELANASLAHFRAGRDVMGESQALQVAAVSARLSNDQRTAAALLRQASAARDRGADPFDVDSPILPLRIPERTGRWDDVIIAARNGGRATASSATVGVPAPGGLTLIAIGGDPEAARAQLQSEVFARRVTASLLAELDWQIIDVSTTTYYLAHLYAYVLPLKMGDCCHRLGRHSAAELLYTQVAAYGSLNRRLEATALWTRAARNALTWGDALYKKADFDGATAQYAKLITADGAVPASFLYQHPAFQVPMAVAAAFIAELPNRAPRRDDGEIAILILRAKQRLAQIAEGLDYFGLLLSPIHTFEYLQEVARGFAHEAIQAEREFITFKANEEAEAAARKDLEAAHAMAAAEAEVQRRQWEAAGEDQAAAEMALQLTAQQHQHAIDQRDLYATTSKKQIWAQAAAQAQAAGEDSYYSEISPLADKLAHGETVEGSPGQLAAAYTLMAGRRTREYELAKMQDTIDELASAIQLATERVDAAIKRTAAALSAWQAALQAVELTVAALEAFDEELFTPDAWDAMAEFMRSLSASYLHRATRIARLMERAYNFENDTQLAVIKNEYGGRNVLNAGRGQSALFAGDSLLLDIDSFTYHAVTSRTRKSSSIKDVISLAMDFPAQFEEFRRTGLLSFDTDLYEFDRLHPGFYGQRLEAVDIELIGLLPGGGLNGTFSAGGVTRFRRKDGTAMQRVHGVDTLALSDFVLREDGFLFRGETGVRGLFQGFGVGTTWRLHLPRRSNDFDLRRIFDVHLVLYYTARYDAGLASQILSQAPRDGEQTRLRDFHLRHDFPDAWYAFYQGGSVDLDFDRFRLPSNQQSFSVEEARFRVVPKAGVSPAGIDLRISAPNGAVGNATTDADGVISSEDPGLAGLKDSDPIGVWKIEALGGVPLLEDGALRFDRIYNVQFGLEYGFEYVPEAI